MWCTTRIDSRANLFLIYVNDMSGAVNHKLLLYADDSAILVADKNVSTIDILLKKELEVVSEWLVDNKLSLHLGKTESMLFGSKIRLKLQSNLQISCKGTHIESNEVVKYLDAVLEQCLSGESMDKLIIQKANARLKFLFRKQKFRNLHSKKLLVIIYNVSYSMSLRLCLFILVSRLVATTTE